MLGCKAFVVVIEQRNWQNASSPARDCSFPRSGFLQGTHSLQLHEKLQRLCLVTDRGLHVDAQISHRLLSLLAQKKQLRKIFIGSGTYRLQGANSGL